MKGKLPLLLLALLLLLLSQGAALAQESPEAVAKRFLDAWHVRDYAAMYAALSGQSQQLIAQPAFEARYQQITDTLALTGVRYTITGSHVQGLSAAVEYDAMIETGLFDTISDPGRTMRLVISGGQWGVAWSSMDIFDVLAGDAQLRVVPQAQARAAIYDRNGLPLTEDTSIVALYGQQLLMPDVSACITLLGRITRDSVITLRQRFANRTPENIFFMGTADINTYSSNIDDLRASCGLQEAYSATSNLRTYYGGSAMTHVVGYIGQIPQESLANYQQRGYAPGDLIGLAGVEARYNDQLYGQPGRALRIVEPGGTVLRELATTVGNPPTPVMLTIDRRLQLITAQAMADAYNYAADSWGSPAISRGGAAVVLDVRSGAILALVSYPLLDPNLFNPQATAIENRGTALQTALSDPRRPQFNHATQDAYAPGSVWKVITHIAALNEALTTPDEVFYCPLEWDGRPFGDTQEVRTDWRLQDGFPEAGNVRPSQALMASCNPFYWRYGAELFNRVSTDRLNDYARQFGIGQPYGLSSAGIQETAAILPIPGSAAEAMNNATGQGNTAVPPLQMAVAVMAVANGGSVYRPYLVQQVGGMDGTPVSFTAQAQVINQAQLNPGVLEDVRAGMCGVTGNPDYGTAFGRFNFLPQHFFGDFEFNYDWNPQAAYSICGKTGTAQASPYPHAWFISYVPADDPQFAIAVMVTNSLEGSQIPAPITRRILDEWFSVPPESYAPYPEWWNTEPYTPLPPVGESGGSQ